MLTILSLLHAVMGRSHSTRRLWRALRIEQVGRNWLRWTILPHERARLDDITVLIAVRNRSDYRLANALSSVRAQTYPAKLVTIIVVDYGSEPASMRETAALCRANGASYVRIEASVWSRSRSMNVGIRQTTTKYLLIADADIIFSPRYLADSVAALRSSPLSVIYAPMHDLPEETTEVVKGAAGMNGDRDLALWKSWCSPRCGWAFHPSIAFTFTAYFQCIRGFDEFYEIYGAEDMDLSRRFAYLGLEPKLLNFDSFYLHQWHPKFEGIPDGEHNTQIERNRVYHGQTYSIVRNNRQWGHGIR